jgi:hypothetical protein
VPLDFNICPLLPALCSQIKTWLCRLPKSMQSPLPSQRSKLVTGNKTTLLPSKTFNWTPTPSCPTWSPALVKHQILGTFAATYWDGYFNLKHNPSTGPAVGTKSVHANINAVAATFRANYHSSPIHDPITFCLAFLL